MYVKEGLNKKIVMAEIFVDDTVFTRNDDLCKAFAEEMSKEFEMSMFGEIKFFVGLHIQQSKNVYLHHSIQVHQGDIEEIWNGRFKANLNPFLLDIRFPKMMIPRL